MITDRKKEIFILSSGKYIAPQMIENRLREASFIDNCLVFGENQKYASAIIIPDMKNVREWCRKNDIHSDNDDDKMISNKKVIEMLNREVAGVNKTLSDFEIIKKSFYVTDDWSVENGMLSQTLKHRRVLIKKKYQAIAESAYK